ncbi:Vacuolar membrane protease, partial [Clydaea vesicula]
MSTQQRNQEKKKKPTTTQNEVNHKQTKELPHLPENIESMKILTKKSTSKLTKGGKSLTLTKNPIKVLKYFSLYLVDSLITLIINISNNAFKISLILGFSATFIAVLNTFFLENGSKVDELKHSLIWFGYWIALGVASSIGLGTGLHTFVLFLGPHIAHTTITAYTCGNMDFDIRGEESFECKSTIQSDINIWIIFVKVAWESFFWGLGTSLGELPPYFVARAAAAAGSDDEDFDSIEKILSTPKEKRSFNESVQVYMYNLMHNFGFFGILLCASIPNPLFDLA